MTKELITDEQIAAMSPAERKVLMERLARPLDQILPSAGFVEWVRRIRLGLMIGGSILLTPWVVFLAVTLPNSYEARNWSLTWVGFDLLLVLLMVTTAILGWKRRQLLILTGFATGVLLVCDAWFDVMTSAPDDIWVSIATAVFAELPLAAILIGGTLRLIRVVAMRNWLLDPGTPLWQLRLPNLAAPQNWGTGTTGNLDLR